jgi:hypothetical protein
MKNIVSFLLFMLLFQGVYSQAESLVVKKDQGTVVQKKFNKKHLEKYKSDKDFNYTEEIKVSEPTFLERVFNWLGRQVSRFLEWLFGVKYAKGILATILRVFPYLIAGIVLFLLIKFFLKVNSNAIISNTSNKAVVSITEDEALIKNKDLSRLIQKAIAQKNYRLAVRYYYLLLLQQLEVKELIIWEQQKTNDDYIHEISETNLKSSFSKVTRLYDFVWYGNFEINELEFGSVEAEFEQIKNLIKS